MKKYPELIIFGIDGGVPQYIRKKVAEGKYPNFAKLIRKGTFLEEVRGVSPTVTPVCWSALQTGSTPEVNGIISDLLHLDGPLSHFVSSYHGDYLKAERLWEAAARIGKTSLVVSLPVSGPARSPLVRQVGGLTCSTGRTLRTDSRYEEYDIPYQLWFFDRNRKPTDSLAHFAAKSSPVVQVDKGVVSHTLPLAAPQEVSKVAEGNNGSYELKVDLDRPHANYHKFAPFQWKLEVKEGKFLLHTEEGIIPLQENEWTLPFCRTLPCEGGELTCSFRFGCFAYEDGYLIYSSATGNCEDVVSPQLHPILKKMPPPPVFYEYVFLRDPVTAPLAFDSYAFNMRWNCEMIRQALKMEPSDIVVAYAGYPDTINHIFWNTYCGAVPADEEAKRFASSCFEKIYEIVDEELGFLMNEVAGENTTILVVSDHGSLGAPSWHSPNDDLAKAGLVHFKNPDTMEVDYSKSKAAAIGFGNIFVNLKGRETDGIVPEEEYEKTVSEIIAALQDNLRSPDGEPYLAFAVRREEAGFVGQGGERAGDVIYGVASGYASQTIHAEQIPTARSKKFGSIACLGILAGPGIPEGRDFSGPVCLTDFAPTLAFLLDYPLPRESNGRIVTQLIEKEVVTGKK